MDMESAIRKHLKLSEAQEELQDITVWINDEGRVVLTMTNPDLVSYEYVIVGDSCISFDHKPPTQRAVVEGFDAFGAMGG